MVMEANFLRALPLVLKHEGGFSNHKDDPGGATNRGITLENYRRYVKGNGTVADLKAISAQDVEKVYRLFYRSAVKEDDLPGGLDYAVFDFAVNSGPGRAIRFMQAVAGVSQDGIVGPATLAAVRSLEPETAIERLCDERLAFLKRLSIWPTFGKGWANRVADVRSHALKMARDGRRAAPSPSASTSAPASAAPSDAPARPQPGNRGVLAAIFAAAGAAAAYFWNQITTLFGG